MAVSDLLNSTFFNIQAAVPFKLSRSDPFLSLHRVLSYKDNHVHSYLVSHQKGPSHRHRLLVVILGVADSYKYV